MIKYCLIIIVCIYPSVSLGGWFGPSTYDECVLESMKGVTSDAAAGAIVRSCRAKFSGKGPNDSEVPANVVGQLDGRAGMTNYGYFKGSIYNGNKDWTITQVTVVLVPKTKDKSLDPARRAKEYNVNLSVPPLTNSDFSVSADGGGSSDFDWSIKSARGHQSR
jgi:hypothetical protein